MSRYSFAVIADAVSGCVCRQDRLARPVRSFAIRFSKHAADSDRMRSRFSLAYRSHSHAGRGAASSRRSILSIPSVGEA